MDDKWTNYNKFLVTATVREATEDDFVELEKSPEFVRNFKQAASPIKDGKPRMLLLTAWIAHEGRNLNGQAFIKQELQQKVQEGLFSPPYAGMIDYNHDFEPRGFWYKASYAYDATAELWGIVANGALWAWRFPELADALLAEMHRENLIAVSMACIPESSEYTRNFPGHEGEFTEILHNPVFFATSVLDIPPADPAGRAVVSEIDDEVPVPAKELDEAATTVQTLIFPKSHWDNSKDAKAWAKSHDFRSDKVDETGSSYRLRQVDPGKFDDNSFATICLTGADKSDPGSEKCRVKAVIGTLKKNATVTVCEMDDEEIEALAELLPVLASAANDNKEKHNMDKELKDLQDQLDQAKEEIQELKDKLASEDFEAKMAEKEEEISALELKVSELEVALKSAADAKDELAKELADTKARLDEFEQRELEKEKDDRLAERIDGLPEFVQKNLEDHEDCEAIKASWREMTEEEFTRVAQSFELAAKSLDLVDKSDKQGGLPAGSSGAPEKTGLDKYIR